MPRLARFTLALLPSFVLALLMYLIIIVPAYSAGIDLTPLTPVVNGIIQIAADVLVVLVTVLAGLAVNWIRAHTRLQNEQALSIIRADVVSIAEKIVKYNADELKGLVPDSLKLEVAVPSDKVATLANYFIAQAPVLLKRAGIDITTATGQAELVRMLTAKLSVQEKKVGMS